jgi:hypothetical protein
MGKGNLRPPRTPCNTGDVIALPVHDAVIVMDEHHLQATKIMKKVFNDHTGITPQVTLE